jgi:small conductance mechanosensitive channel
MKQADNRRGDYRHLALMLHFCLALAASKALAQPVPGFSSPALSQQTAKESELSPVAERVDVEPVARDEQIRERLERILAATGWFTDPKIRVEEGVVFLNGRAETVELKKWAGDLARNTQGVAAVANQMNVTELAMWDFSSARSGLDELRSDVMRALPVLTVGIVILTLTTLAAWGTTRAARRLLTSRITSRLLRGIFARGAGVLVLLIGLYVVLRMSGLTQLALTVVGGTGLVGFAVGIAFRDITENYLASIFLSTQRPFRTGDLVEITGITGYVRQLNIRTTVLMRLDGSVSQLPNATVYKSSIRNFTTNPNRREDFVVGIGYDDRIDQAQEVALRVLSGHPAVLKDPEPWVLVEDLGNSSVNLRVYFWLDGREHSWLKVRSSVIRLIKRTFQDHDISMPDEAREIIFPQGVPVSIVSESSTIAGSDLPLPVIMKGTDHMPDAVATPAEGGLSSEANTLDEQARQAHRPDTTENLLRASTDKKPGI